jgi:hypothetical protein
LPIKFVPVAFIKREPLAHSRSRLTIKAGISLADPLRVDFHCDLSHLTLSAERDAQKGQCSGTYGVFEYNQTHGAAGEAIDPRDCETHWYVAQAAAEAETVAC